MQNHKMRARGSSPHMAGFAGALPPSLVAAALAALVASGCWGAAVETGSEAIHKSVVPASPDLPDPVKAAPTCLADSDCASLATTPCAKAVCDASTRRCILGILPDFGACDDGEPCSAESACRSGVCEALKATDCDDDNPCTTDQCEVGVGCVHADNSPAPCSDGNPCTIGDHCADRTCVVETNVCDCAADADCVALGGANKCVGQFQCSAGFCVVAPGSVTPCDDDNPCTDDGCDPATGDCTSAPVADGFACDDGNICSIEESCVAGQCAAGASLPCAVTETGCVATACDATAGCVVNIDNDGAPCDDGNACSQGDICKGGVCGGKSTCECSADADCAGKATVPACLGQLVCRTGHCEVDANLAQACAPSVAPCTIAICTAAGCVAAQTPAGGPCDDGTACTIGDTCSGAGLCQGGATLQCDDGQPCTADFCAASVGCIHGPGASGQVCDDGNACTKSDVCIGQTCTGEATDCDDGEPCTIDLCDPNNVEACLHKAMPEGADCDDGDTCTSGERCVVGTCTGKEVIDCDDGNPCTHDDCTTDSQCQHQPVNADTAPDCDDGDDCTVEDACADGTCVGQTGACKCKSDKDCAAFEDGDACNGTLRCQANDCVIDPSTVVTCSADAAPCVTLECGPKTGLCGEKPKVSPDGSKIPCDDGNLCTQFEFCLVGGICAGGAPLLCDDGDLCTTDSCDPATGCTVTAADPTAGLPCDDGNQCTMGDACGPSGCDPGTNVCQCTVDADCAAYDDGDVCTGGLVCKQGACQPDGTAVTCDPAGGGVCTEFKCASDTGKCELKAKADGSACDDSQICDSGLCQAGLCIGGGPPPCDDGNPCTKDSCDPVLGCGHVIQAGLFCEDGDPCTAGMACDAAGVCSGGQDVCECQVDADCPDDADLCNDKAACADNKCGLKPGSGVVCDPSGDGPCKTNICAPATGECSLKVLPDQQVCDDGSACTTGELCAGGACTGGLKVDCADGNPCTADGCNPALGCFHLNTQDLCDDGDPCTLGDACSDGACLPGPGKCECVFDADCVAKDDGNLCNGTFTCQAGQCEIDPKTFVQCDASNNTSCTVNVCEPKTGKCGMTPLDDGTQCSDDNVCTGADQCVAGQCKGTVATCDDGNPCSDDACDSAKGCQHQANTAPCDDGNPCTEGDVCGAGSCKAGADICGECNSDADCAAKDDGDLCNGVLHCVAGACQPKPNSAVVCADTGSPCTSGVCQPATGQCKNVSAGDASPCDDKDACTATSACFGGVCLGQNGLNCDDGEACTTDKCDNQAGCVHTPNLGPCDDGNPCTTGDICTPAGGCQSGINICECKLDADCVAKDDGDPCNGTLSCQAGKCAIKPGTVVVCDLSQNTACTVQACDSADGLCKATAVIDGTDCDDGSLCTVGDTCSKGDCAGSVLVCGDGNPCTSDECDSILGCFNKPDDGGPCSDGNPCTQGDLCKGGQCAPGPNACQCQANADCAQFEDDDLCNGTLICQASSCVIDPATVITCGGGDGCSAQKCDAKTGSCNAAPAPDGTPCGGAPLCGGSGQCSAGKCVGEDGCADDGNLCTAASCDGQGQCASDPVAGPCDDGDACTLGDLCDAGVCKSGANQCDCKVDADCVGHDDGDVCNGITTCQNGLCAFDDSTVVSCPPGAGPCQNATCDPKSGDCAITNVPNGTACADDDQCTVAEQCFAGACLKQGITCDDDNDCTDDACDPQQGCVFNNSLPKICDDNDPCTPVSFCLGGSCNAGPINTCNCTTNADCPDDGDKCNGTRVCQGGSCQIDPATVVTCPPWPEACKVNACVAATGQCQSTPVQDGSPCSDGNQCTGGDTCALGLCVGAPIQCSDGVDCTSDVCAPAQGCVFEADPTKCDDNQDCTNDVCSPTGGCVNSPKIGLPCSDGDACTVGDICLMAAGVLTCQPGSALDCDDLNPCTVDTCQGDGGCAHKPSVGPCDDGDACTAPDTCQAGKCLPGADNCACKVDGDCDDGKPCTVDTCVNNACVAGPANGIPCEDKDLCTGSGECVDGNCEPGAFKTCDDGDGCTADACDPASGACKNTQIAGCCKADGDCEDKNACTADSCQVDGCPDGEMLNGRCYKLISSYTSWFEAQDTCLAWGGQLVSVGSQQENAFVRGLGDKASCADIWIGYNDLAKDGQWVWADGTAGNYSNWAPGEPNECQDCCGSPEDVAEMWADGTWNDICFAQTNPCMVCEKSLVGGVCSNVQIAGCCAVDADCEDGDACSIDTCVAGQCQAAQDPACCKADLDCFDANDCTDDVCVAGKCQFNPNSAPCNDGDACTQGDMCQGGACSPGQGVCECQVNADCAAKEDGDVCNGTLVCDANHCVVDPGTVVDCSGQVDETCGAAVCNAQTGQCSKQPGPNGAPCDDGSVCTNADVCAAGKCVGQPISCNDNSVCTADSCDVKDGCQHAPTAGLCDDNNSCTTGDLCQAGACVGGNNICQCQVTADCGKLEDGNLCNGTLICTANKCVINPATLVTCDTSGDTPCKTTACLPQTGQCQTSFLPAGAPCDDGNACSTSDTCKQGGTCSGGAQTPCNDGNPCTQDGCNPASGCTNTPLSNVPCSDGNNCTINDTCSSGTCAGTPTACECQVNADCAAQEDGNFCNGTLHCVDQACEVDTSTIVDCSDLTDPPCGKYACQANNGQCISKSLPNGTPCNDSDACTTADACLNGLCRGQITSCNDDNPCSADSCNASSGECQFVPAVGQPCDDGDACTANDACDGAAKCVGQGSSCDDGNQCTFDVCQADQGCVNVNISGPCDDGDPCTDGESCNLGVCSAGPKDPNCCATDGDCDDLDKCTTDACQNKDCVRAPMVCADDGSECTVEACTDGSCASTVPPPGGAVTLYSENFEDGQANGIYVQSDNKDVTWQVHAGKSASKPNALYLGNTGTMDYDFGLTNADAILPPVQLPASGQAAFRIDYRLLVTNNNCSRDKIQLFVNGQLQVGQLCSSTTEFLTRTWSLNNYLGQQVEITLHFTTVDESDNKGEGAYVDNLRILATGAGDCCTGAQDCDDGHVCTLDACDVKTGTCSSAPNPGGPCDDGQLCTLGDTCDAQGQCQGAAKSCDDGSACTADSCEAGSGNCVNTAIAGFKANFSDGLGGLQTTSSNPQVSWQTSSQEFVSAPTSLYIGNINPVTGVHSYNFGITAATANIPAVAIPAGVSTAFWKFSLKYDRDDNESTNCNSGLVDRVAATLGGQVVGQICTEVPAFFPVTIDLSAQAGQTVNLGYTFFAGPTQNNGQGAWIDDIEVGWTCN